MTVSASSVSNRPVPCGWPFSSSSWTSTVRSPSPIELIVRSQLIRMPSASASAASSSCAGICVPGPAVDDDRVVGTEPAGDPGGVHRRVAAAVHRNGSGERGLLAGLDAAQEAHGVDDPAGVGVGDVDPLAQVGADRDEDRVEAFALGLEVRDPVLLLEDDAQGRYPGDLGVEDVARQAVGGNAVAHHPARLRPVVADDDVVSEPGQVVRGGQAGRAGADDEHPPPAADLGPPELPAPLVGQVAEIALDRMDRHCPVELLAVAGGFARVVADATVDRRERVVVREQPPGFLVLADPGVPQPTLDVLACRAGVVARGQQVDVHRTLRPHRAGAQPGLAERGERSEVAL